MGRVVLEENVFIGDRVMILKGVTVGRDSVVGAGSVVTQAIPAGVVAAGNPARVVRAIHAGDHAHLRSGAQDRLAGRR
jgi:maltose O-acetyltransferase